MNPRIFFSFLFVVLLFFPSFGVSTWAGTLNVPTPTYPTIQAAIDAANNGDQILVASGTYNLTAPIKVTKGVTITGDISNPGNVIINAPTSLATYPSDKDCFQVWTDNVTIEGFTIQGAKNGQPLHTWGYQNAGIFVGGDWADIIVEMNNPIIGVKNTIIRYNEITNNSFGIYAYRAQHLTIEHNKIYANTQNGNWSGKGIELYSQNRNLWNNPNVIDPDPSVQIYDVKILNNEIFNNELMGIELNSSEVNGDLDVKLLIDGNIIYNNGGPLDNIVDVGIGYPWDFFRGIGANGTGNASETGVTITNNEIYNHWTTPGPRFYYGAAIRAYDPKGWIISNNNLHDNVAGIRISGSLASTNSIEGNEIRDNVVGIRFEGGIDGSAHCNSIHGNNVETYKDAPGSSYYDGAFPYGIINKKTTVVFNATNNWWGDPSGPGSVGPGSGDNVSANVTYSPWLSPTLEVTPAIYDYGDVQVNSTKDMTFKITNTTLCVLSVNVTNIQITPGDFSIISGGTVPFTLDPGETHDVIVQFKPTSLGAKTATLTVESDAPTITVPLTGMGIPIQFASFIIEEAKLDWKKKPDDDKARVKGVFNLPEGATPDPNYVILKIGNLSFGPIAMEVKDKGNKWEYKRAKGTTGIKDMKIEWKKKEAKFEVHIDDIELGLMSGWNNPVIFSLQLGAYLGSQSVLMDVKKDKWEYHK